MKQLVLPIEDLQADSMEEALRLLFNEHKIKPSEYYDAYYEAIKNRSP